MKSRKGIELAPGDVEQILKDLSLIIVSMDRIGSTFHDDAEMHAVALEEFLLSVKAFKRLARMRAILSKAHEAQSTKLEMMHFEEAAEKIPYWKPKQK